MKKIIVLLAVGMCILAANSALATVYTFDGLNANLSVTADGGNPGWFIWNYAMTATGSPVTIGGLNLDGAPTGTFGFGTSLTGNTPNILGPLVNPAGWVGVEVDTGLHWIKSAAPNVTIGATPVNFGFKVQTNNIIDGTAAEFVAGQAGQGGPVGVPGPTPVVPEPFSIMLGVMGLGAVVGSRKLHRK